MHAVLVNTTKNRNVYKIFLVGDLDDAKLEGLPFQQSTFFN